MNYSPEPELASPKFSEKLTGAKIKKLSSLILRSEYPRTTDAVTAPLLELVSWEAIRRSDIIIATIELLRGDRRLDIDIKRRLYILIST